METLRSIGPAAAAVGAVILFDHMTRRRGLDPPGFREPLRRIAALALVAFALYVGVFAALGSVGRQGEIDVSLLASWQLFILHGLFAMTIVGWWMSGFVALPKSRNFDPAGPGSEGGIDLPRPLESTDLADLAEPARPADLAVRVEPAGSAAVLLPEPATGWRSFADQFGLRTPYLSRELAVGTVAGFGAWLAVLCGVVLFALVLAAVSGEELLPQTPPAVIPWLAGRSVWLRLAIAASAGLVEEIFFRGFLQPRIGIALSTLFFAMAHLSYDQPIMLVGVTLLSLLYGLLTRWRQNIWPAIVAHFLFDSIQLLVVIPAVLNLFKPGAP